MIIILIILTTLTVSVLLVSPFLFFVMRTSAVDQRKNIEKEIQPLRRNTYPKKFRYAGTLFDKETTQVIQLYERERYRYKWDYHIIFYGKNGTKSMMDLESTDTEYENGDEIYIEFLDRVFKLYKLDHDKHKYQYNPYI